MTFQPCVIIPVYNHAIPLAEITKQVLALGLPVIVVNDGSGPEASQALHDLAKDNDFIEVIEHPENLGKGAAVVSGLRTAHQRGYSHAVQIDADGQHNCSDLNRFLEAAEAEPESMVIGQPQFDDTVPRGRLIARYLTHVWVWIETLSFDIRDSMCGFRVYPIDRVLALADQFRLGRRMDFDPEVLVRLHWSGTRMVTIPTQVIYPIDGISHFRPWQDNMLITWMHTRLFFGMLIRLPRILLGRLRVVLRRSLNEEVQR